MNNKLSANIYRMVNLIAIKKKKTVINQIYLIHVKMKVH